MNTNDSGGFQFAFRRWNLNPRQTAALTGVLLLTLAVYLRCLSNDFVSDDHQEILRNPYIGQWPLLWRSLIHDSSWFSLGQSCYYRPLKNLWDALNFHLFGFHPAGWHALKILLHLSVTLASFRAAQLLTDDVTTGLATALLFGLLPVHTEVVAWISAIPEPLAAFFELAALCCFIQRNRESRWSYVLPAFLFAGALLSFEGAIVFPLLLVVYILLFEAAAESPSSINVWNRMVKAVRHSAPFFVVGLVYFAARSVIVGLRGFPGQEIARLPQVPFVQLLATLPSMILRYVEILTIPWTVGPVHPIEWTNSFESIHFYRSLSILILVAIGSFLLIRRSSRQKLYVFCAAWFLISLLPMLNVVMTVNPYSLAQVVQDRYLYLPSFAFCLLIGDLISRAGRSHRTMRLVFAGLATAVYAAVVWNAQGFWHDPKAMLRREIALAPDSPLYHRNMAMLLSESGDAKGAEREEMIAMRLDPNSDAERAFLDLIQQRLLNQTQGWSSREFPDSP
jgi:hypothetical protein